MLCTEFYVMDRFAFYRNAINKGLVQVNNQWVTLDYTLKPHDRISHLTHKHEPPVCFNREDIEFIPETSGNNPFDLLCIHKPGSLPVHPAGRYRYNSLKWIVNREHFRNDTLCIFNAHRLDVLCSGSTIFTTKHTPKSYVIKLHRRFQRNEIQKEYIAKVIGDFQPQQITVNAPIGILSERKSVAHHNEVNDTAPSIVHDVDLVNGKESITRFEKLYFDGECSLILCRPITGRSHQIRVHLKYIGYPIVNDVKYGGVLMEGDDYRMKPYLDDAERTLEAMIRNHWDENCIECQMILKQLRGEIESPFDNARQICLHSFKYSCDTDGWHFQSKTPVWAQRASDCV